MLRNQQLAGILRDLVRARMIQALVDRFWDGLFWGLAASCLAVPAVRLIGAPYTPWATTGLILALALIAAAVPALVHRRSALQVAIEVDLRLNLKEVVSTAWEFSAAGRDPALSERLAAQALKVKHQLRPDRLFPLRITTRGKLIPLLGALLLFVGVIDVERVAAPPGPAPDPLVAREGARLREYGRQMARRARQAGFQRSLSASERMQSLGGRMQTARLSRNQSLSRLGDLAQELDEQQRAALTDGTRKELGPAEFNSLRGSPLSRGPGLQQLLQGLLDGSLKPEDVEALKGSKDALARLDLTPEDLENALERFSDGDAGKLREILDKLSQAQQSLREAEELRGAREEVDRAREALGERIPGQRSPDRPPLASAGLGHGAPDEMFAGQEFPADAGSGRPADRSGFSPQGSHSEKRPGADLDTERLGFPVKPEPQAREGPVYTTEARAVPRGGQPRVEEVELPARFTAQMEEVLAKEDYPLHFKEYVRRYFLAVNQGEVERLDGVRGEE